MSKLNYRPDIDGLRALAILPVLLFHAGIPGFSGGYIGVDIFFVISGYLITSIIIREVNEQQFSYRDFWARRARRILPASTAMIIATLVTGWFILSPADYVELAVSAREQAYFASNFFFSSNAGYFDGPSEFKPLLHTWSLSVEEQFYLFFPLFFITVHRFFPKHKRAAIILLLLLSLVVSLVLISSQPTSTFYLLHTRAWEMLIGSLLAIAPINLAMRQRPILCEVISLSGLITIVSCIFFYDDTTVFPGAAAIPPTVAVAAIIWANSYSNTWVKRLCTLPPAIWVGLISYSLYLWHWPVIAYTHYYHVGEFTLALKLGLIAVSLILAYLSWRFIETPFRLKQLFPSNNAILIAAAIALIAIAVVSQTIRRDGGYPERLPEHAFKFAQALSRSDDQRRCANLTNSAIREGNICQFGNNQAKPTLLIWGDSHAEALLASMKSAAEESNTAVLFASKSNCRPILVPSEPHGRCQQFNNSMFALASNHGITDVLLVSHWNRASYNAASSDSLASAERNEFKQQFNATVDKLQAQDIRVWVAKQVPVQNTLDVAHELTKLAMQGLPTDTINLPIADHLHKQRYVNNVIDASTVNALDPTPYLCSEQWCPAEENGLALYKDSDHLSAQGALKLEPMFKQLFLQIKQAK
ncbi:hypothetical protein SIN8267_02985 [Sinobacterium norvegicum]|uniref:Acyltransferase n=1 Tax=Sinobacterium norvegicum TaxID=1641715 RepID=A0ABM9AI78_9GAMM|nr:acyltransferase family protein [Sinobacterium norvegicum]CAH0992848.1 hypothetical protein SIN8267_02985 [Sinobacterium norvegicum]